MCQIALPECWLAVQTKRWMQVASPWIGWAPAGASMHRNDPLANTYALHLLAHSCLSMFAVQKTSQWSAWRTIGPKFGLGKALRASCTGAGDMKALSQTINRRLVLDESLQLNSCG